MRNRRVDRALASVLLLSGGVAWGAGGPDDGEPVPDVEFLEYLGSWEASDEEWLLFAGEYDRPGEQDDPAPDGDAPAGRDDEP